MLDRSECSGEFRRQKSALACCAILLQEAKTERQIVEFELVLRRCFALIHRG